MRFAELTTFRVGGPADDVVTATGRDELVDFCVRHPLAPGGAGAPALFVGGGSNLVVADDGFAGSVCLIRTTGRAADGDLLTVEAGETWDDLVAWCVAEGRSGLEALSGIPGSVGATPIQNVGAYGAEVAEVIDSVLVHDRTTGRERSLTGTELGFGYRTSMLKRSAAEHGEVRFVVLAVTFRLPHSEGSAPVRYEQLARALGVELGTRVDASRVRGAVLDLRASKGMVLDPDDQDTWSAGSFFTNPILPAGAALPAAAPRFAVTDPVTGEVDASVVKTSAAWLIDHAGFGRGFGVGDRRATLSTKHVLALTNRGDARAADIIELARAVRAGVEEAFGVRLVPEPNLVGCAL